MIVTLSKAWEEMMMLVFAGGSIFMIIETRVECEFSAAYMVLMTKKLKIGCVRFIRHILASVHMKCSKEL